MLNETLTKFNWTPQPAAQRMVDDFTARFLARNRFAASLCKRMTEETGTRFKDWIDHIAVPKDEGLARLLVQSGFTREPRPNAPDAYECRAGIFPTIILHSGRAGGGGGGGVGGGDAGHEADTHQIAVKVDSVIDFMAAHHLSDHASINDGRPDTGTGSRLRTVLGSRETHYDGTYELWAIERHGFAGFDHCDSTFEQRYKALMHLERLRTRRRDFPSDTDGFAEVNRLVDAAIADLGADWTCDLFFEAERRYWTSRNRAAQVQLGRQNKLGLGWANHDHHTYRGSREHFTKLIALWEKLGFHSRESFYAGAEAGWGAQVMEQPVTKITTFNDVDMSPEELMQDFAHEGFTEDRPGLGTVGLWCGLHGEAVLQAGMHHLECQFDWHALVEQLEKQAHVRTMMPFTTFPHLRQAFTEGERWTVDPARIESLRADGLITPEQAEQFRAHGAIGSHLENLERNDGFKGFNQQGVSDIIARTDPRRLVKELARV